MPDAETVLSLMALFMAGLFGYWWGEHDGWEAAWREAYKRFPAAKPRTMDSKRLSVKSQAGSATE